MCGIAGAISLNHAPIGRDVVERMGRSLRHRGPDQEGHYFEDSVGLVIERLKVIDLVSGTQPMYNEMRDVVVVYNGEIYNYKELRVELEKRGHTFSSQSDTETIVHLYEEYGDSFVDHLNGMFGVALWDMKKRRLVLSRDPAGMKPLFYALHNNTLYFGSEIKSILTTPNFPRTVSPDAFNAYLSFYYVTAPRTIYERIHRLPAGHQLIVENGNVRLKQYWDYSFHPDRTLSLEDAKGEFRRILQDSVKRHLQSDVPVGVFLSGGLDSGAIVSAASRYATRVKTFSVGYKEASYSELKEAALIAKQFNTDHHEIFLSGNDMKDLLPAVIQQHDEPLGDWSHVPNYVLAREAKKDVTVVLVGSGGDELFGGYPTLTAAKAARVYRQLPGWIKNGLIKTAVNHMPTSFERMSLDFIARSFVRGADYPAEEAHRRFKEIFNEADREGLLQPTVRLALNADVPRNVFEQYKETYQSMDWMERLLYLDFKVFLAHCPLYVNDITTAAHAVEGRIPFLDKEMMDLSARLPWNLKVPGLQTKYLMREALRGELPDSIVSMKKKGFLVPGAVWIKNDLKSYLLDVINQAEKELKWLFNFSAVHRMVAEHFEGKADHTRRISCLVSLFLWHFSAVPDWGLLNTKKEGAYV